MQLLPQHVIDTWNEYVNRSPQEFMTLSRQGSLDTTLEQAVDEYVRSIPYMFGEYHQVENEETGETDLEPWSQAELEDIRGKLIAYLEATQDDEWH